ncbi:MAG: cytochrome C oxidase subunit IV family protein [Chitinophagaceae bacterium]|nr:cytochrome C oxidase subunit IV family protein [Chitinophagaceae bacterium]
MEHVNQAVAITPEISFPHEPAPNTKKIWKAFWALLILTIAELALGLSHYAFHVQGWVLMFLKGLMIILSLSKAVYIVSIFMHLGDETRNLRMAILVPLISFAWFIFAFLWDGNAYRNMRNRYDVPAPTQQVAPAVVPEPGSLK